MNNSMKYIIATIILLVGVVGISFYSCEKEEITPNEYTPQVIQEMDADASNTERTETDVRPSGEELITPEAFLDESLVFIEPETLCGKPFQKDLTNQSGKVIGTTYVFNTDKNMYVWLVINEGYKMKTAQLHLASDPKKFPMTNDGKPDIRKFKYSTPDGKEIGRVMDFKIPLQQLNGTSFVAVTTEFQNPEGTWLRGWVGTTILNGTVNAKIFKYTEQKCTVDPTNPGKPDNDNPDA